MKVQELKQLYEVKARRNFSSFLIATCYSLFILSPLQFFKVGYRIDLLVVVIIHLCLGLFSLRLLFWLILGSEKILIDDEFLYIRRTGTFFIKDKKIEVKSIAKIDIYLNLYERELGYDGFKGNVTKLRNIFPTIKIQNIGRLIIVFDASSEYKILNGISIEEGNRVQKLIQDEINKVSQKSK